MKVFYIVFTLFVPILMTVCGIAMKKCHSDEPNNIIGYRTKRSVKNKDTWKFANELAGTLWIKTGVILTVLSAVFSIIYFYVSAKSGVWIMMSAMIIQSGFMIGTIYPVEKALQEKFDENGSKN